MARNLNPIPDSCRIKLKEKLEKVHKPKRKYRKVKNEVNIPKVVSNYKNPNSELIPLELRKKNIKQETNIVNYKKFIDFNKFLDKIEEYCRREYKQL
jgi:hypothetical protein